MKFLQRLFGSVESVTFWRDRAEMLEKKLEGERERHRIRESELLDEILKIVGSKPIFESSETKADIDGKRAERIKYLREKTDAEAAKRIALERKAFIADSVRNGASEEESAAYFDEHQTEILSS